MLRILRLKRLSTIPDKLDSPSVLVLWFENLFPLTKSRFDPRNLLAPGYSAEMKTTLYKTLIPKQENFTVKKSVPHFKDGGLFLHLNFDEKIISHEDLLGKVKEHLATKPIKPIYTFRQVTVREVKGKPFIEDMTGYVPNRKLKIDFQGPELSIESLYRKLRRYGRIAQISIRPPTKDVIPCASVIFSNALSASSARNCAHGQIIPNESNPQQSTRLSISYEQTLTIYQTIMKWVKDHPRIMIPLIIALLGATTYVIFDPLRVWFIHNQLSSNYGFDRFKDKLSKWFMGLAEYSQLANIFSSKSTNVSKFKDLIMEETRLSTVLLEVPDTITILYGPRGKSNLVSSVKGHLKYHLTIDCDELVNIPEHDMLSRLAKQIGFYPQLNFLVTASGLIDTLIAATTGAKAGFTTTSESQVRKMLETLTLAITRITVEQLRKQSLVVENKPNETEIHYPVIFIEGFMSKDKVERNDYLYNLLANWAAMIEENRLAHVVFVTYNPGAVKTLSKVISNKPIQSINLNDADIDTSLAYVKDRINMEKTPIEMKEYIQGLGGRRIDLEFFIQKIKSGIVPQQAYDDIISKSVSELRKVGFEQDQNAKEKTNWTTPQFWKVIELMAKYDTVDYDELKQNNLFKGNDIPIQQMENAGLIAIEQIDGRPKILHPGRPIYKPAFIRMVSDSKLKATMGIQTTKILKQDEELKIQKYETELVSILQIISGFGASSDGRLLSFEMRDGLNNRIEFLGMLLSESHEKIKAWENKEREYKKILKLNE